jgi:23S rRNA (adenine2503-C2)-methyltransferase
MTDETSPIDIFSLTRSGLELEAARTLPSGAGIAGRLYRRLFSTGKYEPEDFGLSVTNAASWRRGFSANPLVSSLVAEEPGEFGPTAKAVLRTSDGLAIECVLIPMSTREIDESRATLCVSSQAGCRMGCAFCETGLGGLARSLTAGEIVAQVFTARFALGWRFRNIVFMGMGEPLDNAENLIGSLRILLDPSGFGFSQERITVCTVGHVDGLCRLAREPWPRLNLSVSLNSADQATRDALMPIGRRWPLDDLSQALSDYPKHRNFILGVNYCLIPGMNDDPEDARRVAAFCAPLGRVTVNLIPYNPGSAPIGRSPTEDEVETFIALLKAENLTVRRRATKGRSIMAACGQLGRSER